MPRTALLDDHRADGLPPRSPARSAGAPRSPSSQSSLDMQPVLLRRWKPPGPTFPGDRRGGMPPTSCFDILAGCTGAAVRPTDPPPPAVRLPGRRRWSLWRRPAKNRLCWRLHSQRRPQFGRHEFVVYFKGAAPSARPTPSVPPPPPVAIGAAPAAAAELMRNARFGRHHDEACLASTAVRPELKSLPRAALSMQGGCILTRPRSRRRPGTLLSKAARCRTSSRSGADSRPVDNSPVSVCRPSASTWHAGWAPGSKPRPASPTDTVATALRPARALAARRAAHHPGLLRLISFTPPAHAEFDHRAPSHSR